jgi:hypothetical protein
MSRRWHVEHPDCACFACTELRYHNADAVRAEKLLEEERLAALERAERELQLRLPITPLPHVAHQGAHL